MYTIQGKTWYTQHVCFPHQSTYVTRTLPVSGLHTWQPFTLTQQSWTDSLLQRKSALDSTSQPGWVAHGTRLSFSPKHNHWSSAFKPNIYWWTCYIGLLDPYHQHVISTFNTCSREANPSVFNRHRRRLQLWRCRFPTYHSPTFPTSGLHFPPKGSAWSQVIQNIPKILRFKFK
jgi:hypothetical protein